MEQTEYTVFVYSREHLGMSQQDVANLAQVDVSLVEKYEKGESTTQDLTVRDQIVGALFKVLVRRYPEKLRAAVLPVLEEAKKYPEGSKMRNFLSHAGNWLKLIEDSPSEPK